MTVEIKRATAGFSDWEVLLKLLQDAFTYQNGRIDPPSSVQGTRYGSAGLESEE